MLVRLLIRPLVHRPQRPLPRCSAAPQVAALLCRSCSRIGGACAVKLVMPGIRHTAYGIRKHAFGEVVPEMPVNVPGHFKGLRHVRSSRSPLTAHRSPLEHAFARPSAVLTSAPECRRVSERRSTAAFPHRRTPGVRKNQSAALGHARRIAANLREGQDATMAVSPSRDRHGCRRLCRPRKRSARQMQAARTVCVCPNTSQAPIKRSTCRRMTGERCGAMGN